MKSSFTNPGAMARNAIGAVTVMSLINVVLVYFNLPPIMPLGLTMPISFAVMAFRTPASIVELYPDPAQLAFFRQVSLIWVIIILAILAYAFWRMTKKPKAVMIGLVVVVLDTIALTSLYPILSLGFVVELVYHALVLYYLFKGYQAIKQESAHV